MTLGSPFMLHVPFADPVVAGAPACAAVARLRSRRERARTSDLAGGRLRRSLGATMEDDGGRECAQDDCALRKKCLQRRVEAERRDPRSAPDLVIGKDLSFLEFLKSF